MRSAVAFFFASAVALIACRPSESADGARTMDASAPTTTATAETEAGAPTPSASVAVTPSATPDASAAPVLDPAFRGIHHLDAPLDEQNLVIASDGTFFWTIYGCDFSGGGCGTWKPDSAGLVLRPKPPATTMQWGGSPPITRVTVRARAGGFDVEAFPTSGAVMKQHWSSGEVCAQCGASLGPSAAPRACSKPLTPPACN